MTSHPRRTPLVWRIIRSLKPRMLRAYARNPRMHSLVLLLTTTGRRSGSPRVTPLQYEEIDGVIHVASARGPQADWFRNLQADPHVTVQIGAEAFPAIAEPILDPSRIADFLEIRLARHPRMIGAMLRAEGLPRRHTRGDLERFASGKAVAALHRTGQG
jgi:deazaflavin-dependent oxidoreductase (nitroreductase family)